MCILFGFLIILFKVRLFEYIFRWIYVVYWLICGRIVDELSLMIGWNGIFGRIVEGFVVFYYEGMSKFWNNFLNYKLNEVGIEWLVESFIKFFGWRLIR